MEKELENFDKLIYLTYKLLLYLIGFIYEV